MTIFYSASEDQLFEAADAGGLPDDAVALDPIRASMFVYAESRGQRVNRDAIQAAMPDPARARAEASEARRMQRNALLAASDWTQLPDTLGKGSGLKARWKQYRKELRALDLDGSDWPDSP